MRKLFALLFVAGAFTFASCQGGENKEAAVDSTAAPIEEAPVDTAAVAPADSAAAPAADSAHAAPAAH